MAATQLRPAKSIGIIIPMAHLYTVNGVCALAGGFSCLSSRNQGAAPPPEPQRYTAQVLPHKGGLTLVPCLKHTRTKGGLPIAIYHCSIKIVSRGKGKSAVAAAAYRAGEIIKNEYDGITHDYTRKGGVVHTEILLPDNAPPEYADRATLWNAVEKVESAKNSQLAREIELALPIELSLGQNTNLVREYAKQNFVRHGMCADICIHDTGNGNPHVHILLTMRPFEKNSEWSAKSKKEYILDVSGERIRLKSGEFKSRKIPAVDWNNRDKAEQWRAAWAEIANKYLERLNHPAQLDHRSYERQGLDIVPSIHLGVTASQMERQGIPTNRGDINRDVEITNSHLRQIKARIDKLKGWLIEESKIRDMSDLETKVMEMYGRQREMASKLNAIDRRIKALDEHIMQAGYYLEFKPFYQKYKEVKPRKQADYYENNRRELALYEYAERYLKGVMNGKTGLPVNTWKAERSKLTAEKNTLYQKYYLLKEEVREAEAERRSAQNAVRREGRDRRSRLSLDMER